MKMPDSLKFTGKDSSIVGQDKQKLLESIYARLRLERSLNAQSKKDFSGQLPGLFVGSYGYPKVNAGFLSSLYYKDENEPLLWSANRQKYDLLSIIKLRSTLTNSNFNVDVKNKDRYISEMKDISLAIKPVDAEVNLQKKPYFSLTISRDELPRGPSVPLKKISITENPKIPGYVDKIESDYDLKAESSVSYLAKKGYDEHYITKIFSGGNLGVKMERKMVPTKWSITAVDDILGKSAIKNSILNFQEHDYSIYFGSYMGNYYVCLVFPGPWSYELFETYVGDGLLNPLIYESAIDFEGPFGRKTYASNTVGGYYASRLAVLEHFRNLKRMGSVLMLRFITSEYWAPLGVWVVREASRNAFKKKSMAFDSKEALLDYARKLIYTKFKLDVKKIYSESSLLKQLKEQSTLSKFF